MGQTAPQVRGFFDATTSTLSYLVADPATGAAAIVDPVLDYEPKAARTSTASADQLIAAAAGLKVEWILETHTHADHLSAAPYVKLEVSVLHTPGHTPACNTYVVRAQDSPACAFVGDTLFMPDYGTARADFPGGDARQLYRSIRRILSLPPDTRVFVGHDYQPGGRTVAYEATVAEHCGANRHVKDGTTEDAFVEFRTNRDRTLDMPTLLLPSIQVNIRAGRLPAPESNGIAYLKIPLNHF
jgi:glyoxylase-like metal-dependent hydrolase (beta-lactamase superfamily II)